MELCAHYKPIRHRNRKARESAELIVPFEDDLLAVPAVVGEQVPDRGDHEIKAANVGVDVEAELGGRD